MADVSPPLRSGAGDDRGQLLLVGALALAVMFVSLAFLLNAAIYTETIATQASGADVTGLFEYRTNAESAAARSVTALSVGRNATYESMNANLTAGMAAWDAAAARHYATDGDVPSVETLSIRTGTRVVQTDSRNFTDAAGATDWTLVTDAEVRNGTMVVDRDGAATVDDETLSALSGTAFRLNVTATGGGSYSVYVYRDPSDSDALSLRAFADGSPVDDDSCTHLGETIRVDVTGERFGGAHCNDLASLWTAGGAYSVSFHEATAIQGSYSVTVSHPLDELDGSHYAEFGGPGPFRSTAIYAVDIEGVYRSPSAYHRWETTVAPGAVA